MKTTNLLILIIVGLLTNQTSKAQTARLPQINYFNLFQQNVSEHNRDSALYNAQHVAAQSSDMANFLIHDSFAHAFALPSSSTNDTTFAFQLLRQMKASNEPLQHVVYPLYQWTTIKQRLTDTALVNRMVNEMMADQERAEEKNGNRIDRYALLVYTLLKPYPHYHPLADTLLAHTQQRLEHATNGVYYQSINGERAHRNQRAYFRFLAAYLASVKAEEAMQQNDIANAKQYYQRASELSPDENDLASKSSFFYESFMLLGKEVDDFNTPYITFLEKQGVSTDTLLALMTKRALIDPVSLPKLQAFYEKVGSPKGTFKNYWRDQLNTPLKLAENFQIADLEQSVFNYEQYKGKWVLLDFWGTWCGPCVAELPDMQRFYERMKNRKDIVVLTVACSDTEPRVRQFMAKNKYTFPVAMADATIEKQFRVGEYPTKVLITPQGKRMKIPFGANWSNRIDIYTVNE